MEKQPGQFGIFSLLVLMTAAAVAFAVVRLPVPLVGKVCATLVIAVCFFGWAVRDWKYPDPRKPTDREISPTRRRVGLVLRVLFSLIYAGWMLVSLLRLNVWRGGVAEAIVWTAIPTLVAVQVWNAVRRW